MNWYFVILFLSAPFIYGQVGINTDNPQQTLHLAGATGTIRVESLNHTNNIFNGGDIDNDGNLSNNTYPLYVDEKGDFTLELKTLINSEDLDAFDDTSLPTSSVYLSPNNLIGKDSTVIKTYTIKVSRASIIEIKYNISFDIYKNNTMVTLNDQLARRVTNYITLTPEGVIANNSTRHFGAASKAYSSGSLESVTGTFYNGATTYISIPSGGYWDISFWGVVSSNTRANTGDYPTVALGTYVEFATGNDFLFFRKY